MQTIPLRERRHQQALKDRARLERQRDDTLDKLSRIAAKLKAVRRSVERYERTPMHPVKPEPLAVTIFREMAKDAPAASVNVEPPAPTPAPQAAAPVPAPASVDDDMPDFLRRSKPDAVGEAIAAEQEARRKAKAHGRIATLKAKKSGATKQMPLEGKAALAAIRGG
jgi:hypothetical protein